MGGWTARREAIERERERARPRQIERQRLRGKDRDAETKMQRQKRRDTTGGRVDLGALSMAEYNRDA